MPKPERTISRHVGELIDDPQRKATHARNWLLAKKPRFAIIGTGRSGTTFTAKHLTKAGVPVSHEMYFTYDGPRLRNPLRDFRTIGDSSWCAVPFLPDPDIVAIHQVRHPYDVIRSWFNAGFFDGRHNAQRARFVALAKRHFQFSENPLQSSLRWYVEWNERCEGITDKRFQIERFFERADEIAQWLWLDVDLSAKVTATDTNTREPVVDRPLLDLKEKLVEFPEFDDLRRVADRYGYEL